MQVKTMRSLPRHDVDPAIGHRQFATLEVPIERIRKGLYMTLQLAFQRGKRRRFSLQSVTRTIGGITARVVLGGPSAARRVVFSKLPAFFQKLPIEFSRVGALQSRGIDKGGEQGLDGHPLKTSGGPCICEPRRSGSADDHCPPRAERCFLPTTAPAMNATVPAARMPVATASQG